MNETEHQSKKADAQAEVRETPEQAEALGFKEATEQLQECGQVVSLTEWKEDEELNRAYRMGVVRACAAAPQPRKATPRGEPAKAPFGLDQEHGLNITPQPAKHQEWRGIEKDDPAQPAKAAQTAQYGEGETKFYADKRGAETVRTYKLSAEQRDEVLRLEEDAENDLDAVLFKLVAQRDETAAELERVKQQRDDSIRTLKAVLSMISQRVAFSDESANDQKSLEILRGDCFIARQHIHEFIANAEKEAK